MRKRPPPVQIRRYQDGHRRATKPLISPLFFRREDPVCKCRLTRLPTEAEWETFAASQARGGNFLEDGLCDPAPARAVTDGGAVPVFGDGWERTRSSCEP